MHTVYILKSRKAEKSYVGMTQDIERRIEEHNSGKHAYTRRYTPWDIVDTEVFSSRAEARQREKYLKSASGRKYLKQLFSTI